MKKTGKLLSIMIIAILVVIMIVSNNTNAQNIVELSTKNPSVNVGDTFYINLDGEGMKLINLNLISNLFSGSLSLITSAHSIIQTPPLLK